MIYDLDTPDGLDELFAAAGMDASALRGERIVFGTLHGKQRRTIETEDSDFR